jgi:cysteine desulfurase/selenocysteine lyase
VSHPDRQLDKGGLRADFPIFHNDGQMDGGDNGLVYLDSGASAQKPFEVIKAVTDFYSSGYANIHRGVYALSEQATARYEGARRKVQKFLNAAAPQEIIFVRGTTEGINLVAATFGRRNVGPGDEVLITHLEHHSNIVPWQMLCEEKGAKLQVVPIDERGQVDMAAFAEALNERTRLVAVSHVSNALGTINPVKRMVTLAHEKDIPVLVDGAQAVAHLAVDVQDLGCDFYVFSGHKMYGPTGIGAVYGKRHLLEAMPPYHGGGDMIESVTFAKTTYAPLPARLEAGTPNIAGAIGLGAAVDYLTNIGFETIDRHGQDLLAYGTRVLEEIPGLRLIGTARHKVPVFSFVLDGVHPHDMGTILAHENIAIRAGHHCAQPVMDYFQVPATTRASLGVYNTREDLDALVAGINKIREFFE